MDKQEQEHPSREMQIYIQRYDPEADAKPHWQRFDVVVDHGMTILEALHRIKETRDPSLCYRFSCRMGICGSCAMLINGVPMLACNTQAFSISERALAIAPLPNFDIIKDLVPDLAPMFEKHQSVEPYIQRRDKAQLETPVGMYRQAPEEMERYLQFAYCIKCGACMAACPTMATDRDYLGPMPLAQAYRYSTDTRDEGFDNRKVPAGSHYGAFRCHYAGECSRVCPKGVDPGRAIQLMKRRLVLTYLHLARRRNPADLLGPDPNAVRDPSIPSAPPYTVEQR
jgi:succinate dehydrogenase / fumarate reductase iron-sulfur subunit